MYTIDQILRAAGIGFQTVRTVIRLTAGNQLIGTYADLTNYRGSDNDYRGWEVHHILEALDLDRLGLTNFSPAYEQQICVLIPAAAHQRVNSILRRGNPTRLTATIQDLDPAYRDAYETIGNYCGSSEAVVRRELLAIFRATVQTLNAAATAHRAPQIAKALEEVARLERKIDLDKSLHRKLIEGQSPGVMQTAQFVAGLGNPLMAAGALLDPANRSVIGAAVEAFNPVKRPDLTVWSKAEGAARAAREAIARGDPVAAAARIAIGNGHHKRAATEVEAWRDGVALGARRTQLAVGAVAVLVASAAVVIYAAEAAAVATAATAATTATNTATSGSAATNVRVLVEVEQAMTRLVTAQTLAEEQIAEELVIEETTKAARQMFLPKP